jgi:phosphoribosyl 1,2-cyclic phosphate phosphodiesterase
LALNRIDDKPFVINDVQITPLPVMHMKLPVLGFRIGDLSYITDANYIPDETFEKLKGTRILVLNALQVEPHVSHFNLKEALAVARKIQADETYFTHISHKLGLHAAIEKELPPSVSLGYDGLEISMSS